MYSSLPAKQKWMQQVYTSLNHIHPATIDLTSKQVGQRRSFRNVRVVYENEMYFLFAGKRKVAGAFLRIGNESVTSRLRNYRDTQRHICLTILPLHLYIGRYFLALHTYKYCVFSMNKQQILVNTASTLHLAQSLRISTCLTMACLYEEQYFKAQLSP